ncbi:MAG: Hpt domain-containing protein [Magnetococcales bacterium]|nr:Hpt domain-containing protein [Magnetococcales bacterium]
MLLKTQLPELMGALERDLGKGDFVSAQAVSHVLKGSMANAIFPTLQEPTRSLHEAIRDGDGEEALEILGRIRRVFTPIRLVLEEF